MSIMGVIKIGSLSVRLITPTAKGVETLQAVLPRMLKSQDRLLGPLTTPEQKEFTRLMQVILDANAELSNTPAKE